MLQSIRNFAKGKLAKVLLVILIIPFVLWGMGDVFRGGSQTTIATLNDKRISITDYINHFNSLNVSREFIINNPETKIFEEALNKLDESLSLHLLNSTAHTLRIDVLYNLNRYDEAWRAVHKAQAANILVPKGSLDRLAKALPEPKKIP